MERTKLAALGLGALAALATPAALADSYMELEHARANARAGGPISESDAELLERYGCLSGTKSAFCESLRRGKETPYRSERTRERR